MKIIVIVLDGAALATGLVAAWKWYLSDEVAYNPESTIPFDAQAPAGMTEQMWEGIRYATAWMDHARKVGDFNKAASLWTAATAILSAASAIFGA